MPERSLYDVLNVAAAAEPEVIEAAYRSLMKKYHPDRTAGVGEKASRINAAYNVLRDRRRRADYDLREAARRHAAAGPAMPWAAQDMTPPRRISAAEWSGWVVALMIACFVATMPSERPIAISPAAAQMSPAVAAAGFAGEAPAPSLPPALQGTMLPPLPSEAEAGPVASPVAAALSIAPSPAQPRRARSLQQRRPAVAGRGRGAAAPQAADRDFLEREGYIY